MKQTGRRVVGLGVVLLAGLAVSAGCNKKKAEAKLQTPCDGMQVSVASVAGEEPVMLHLPDGGTRITMRIHNDNDFDVELPAADSVAFVDSDDVSYEPITVPGTQTWFMPTTVPAHTKKELAIILKPGLSESDLKGAHIREIRKAGTLGVTCELKTEL